MAWIVITAADLNDYLVAAQANAIRNAALGTATLAGNLVSGSPIVTALASTAALIAGMTVTHASVPVGAVILTIDSLTQVTLDKNATGNATAGSLVIAQADRFTRVMPDVAARIRNEVQACPRNQISETANAIPPELKTIACCLIIEAMQSAIPGLDLSEDQRNLIRDGRDYLKRIAECKAVISQPDDPLVPADVQSNVGADWGSKHRIHI